MAIIGSYERHVDLGCEAVVFLDDESDACVQLQRDLPGGARPDEYCLTTGASAPVYGAVTAWRRTGDRFEFALIPRAARLFGDEVISFEVAAGDYVETRLMLPDEAGFWPSTWTWNGDGSNEQDTYEYYSDNPRRLYLTNHDAQTGCEYDAPADLTGDWHTIGETLGPDETVWYLDGTEICRGGGYSGSGALLLDMFVYEQKPPTVDEASMRVDYVRVHRQ